MIERTPLVLIVDDQDDGRVLLREALEQDGFAVAEAENGKVALERMRATPELDVVILDLKMPVMSGKELVDEMRGDETLARLPVLVLSGATDTEIPFGAPVVRQLPKPCALTRLLAALRESLGSPSSGKRG